MRYHDLPTGENALRIVKAVIETPQGSGSGYNAAPDSFVLDRVFASPLCYPIFPGCVVRARSIGAVHTHDRRGEDLTIVSAARPDPRYDQVASLGDLPKNALRDIHSLFIVCRHIDCEDTEIIREAAELHRSSASRRR